MTHEIPWHENEWKTKMVNVYDTVNEDKNEV